MTRITPSSSRSAFSSFSAAHLDALSDEELDTLPFGVIGLDAEGSIRRYNVAEARFARLDRAQVVGKSFFTEIARCTATAEFQGRFEVLVKTPESESIAFDFVFAFRFGAQQVNIDIGRAPGTARFYVCVNRKKFLPRLKNVSASIEAPLIAELEPDAALASVLRDEQGRRRLEIDPTLLQTLFASTSRRMAHEADTFLRDWGTAWGRVAVVDLETEMLQVREKLLGEVPMAEAMNALGAYLHRQRLGHLVLSFEHAAHGALVLAVERSAFSESSSRGCAVLEGLFAAVLSHLARRPLVVREARCRARGAARCELVATAMTRLTALDDAVATLSTPVPDVIKKLTEEAARGGA